MEDDAGNIPAGSAWRKPPKGWPRARLAVMVVPVLLAIFISLRGIQWDIGDLRERLGRLFAVAGRRDDLELAYKEASVGLIWAFLNCG